MVRFLHGRGKAFFPFSSPARVPAVAGGRAHAREAPEVVDDRQGQSVLDSTAGRNDDGAHVEEEPLFRPDDSGCFLVDVRSVDRCGPVAVVVGDLVVDCREELRLRVAVEPAPSPDPGVCPVRVVSWVDAVSRGVERRETGARTRVDSADDESSGDDDLGRLGKTSSPWLEVGLYPDFADDASESVPAVLDVREGSRCTADVDVVDGEGNLTNGEGTDCASDSEAEDTESGASSDGVVA